MTFYTAFLHDNFPINFIAIFVWQASNHKQFVITYFFLQLLRQSTKERHQCVTSKCIITEPHHYKTNKMSVRPAKAQISLGIRPVWSESSLSAQRKLGSLATHWTHSEDSDQTGRMPRLIRVFAGRTTTLLVLSCRGSYYSSIWSEYHYHLSHIMRKHVFGDFRPGKVQTSLLSYRN